MIAKRERSAGRLATPDRGGRPSVRIFSFSPAEKNGFRSSIKLTDPTDRARYDLYVDALRRQELKGSARLVTDTIAGRLTASFELTPLRDADNATIELLHDRFTAGLEAWIAAGRPPYNSVEQLKAYLPQREPRRRS